MRAPALASDRVGFLAKLQNIDVTPALAAARVVVNARTGSVVMNQLVKLEPCAVAHGSLSVTISTEPVVSQPAPFSPKSETVVVPQSTVMPSESVTSNGACRVTSPVLVSTKVYWIVPPMSGATTRVFHTPMREFPTTPDFQLQPGPPV